MLKIVHPKSAVFHKYFYLFLNTLYPWASWRLFFFREWNQAVKMVRTCPFVFHFISNCDEKKLDKNNLCVILCLLGYYLTNLSITRYNVFLYQ